MSTSYYRNPRGRMIKMCIMFGSLCFSAYMLPKTIDKLNDSGLGTVLMPGGGLPADAQRMLEKGGLDAALGAERASIRQSGAKAPMVITPSGEMSQAEYVRLQQQAQRTAPIRIVKGAPPEPGEGAEPVQGATTDAGGDNAAVDQLLELLKEQQDKDG
ncbi:MAG: hypothetical protein H6813_00385 [Phycisphaeraceae bacterium]|nr:hypothetical protein [Phycisphaeraceae bacterium]MCB9847458.1 hypothetical protein [Phycisphaeraceae bacterium]